MILVFQSLQNACFIANNDLLSHKRKETELNKLQNPNLELKLEVKVKFQGFNLYSVFHVATIEHKTTPAPFEVVHEILIFFLFNIWQNRVLQPLFRT